MRRLELRALTPFLAAILAAWAGACDARSHGAARALFGVRDLAGTWSNATLTPLERPAEFDALTTSEARAAEFEKRNPEAYNADTSDGVGGRQSEWWERGARMTRIDGQIRTSSIIDPADGRLPYSQAGRALLDASLKSRLANFDGPEVRPSPERCLTGGSGSTGAPILNGTYNTNYQIVQTAAAVAIFAESNHEVRIIRLKGPGHPPTNVRRWMGDSIGRWEGRTLVVETSNFKAGDAFKSPNSIYISPEAVVTERFMRISRQEILYEFAVADPKVFTKTWRGQLVFRASKAPIYEYACHEGNYSLAGILAGARRQEADARAAKGGK